MVYHAVTDLELEGGICDGLAQPEGLHGHEDRAARRLPVGATPASCRCATAPRRVRPVAGRGEIRTEDVWPGFVEKVLSFVDATRSGRCASSWTPRTGWPA